MLFTVVAYSLTCVRQKFYNIFIWLNYVVLKPTLTLNVVFLGIIWPDLIFIFLIIAFFIVTLLKECHILKLSSIYSNPFKIDASKVVYRLDDLANLVKKM